MEGVNFPDFSSAFSFAWTSLALSNSFLSFLCIESPVAGPWYWENVRVLKPLRTSAKESNENVQWSETERMHSV